MADAERYLRAIIAAGVDAAIVQDIGLCRLIRRLSPDFPIHASTQMTITSAAGVEFARELGCSLVVLARECSLKEIEKIQAALDDRDKAQPKAGMERKAAFPLEVFVHGALCVAYSGQCLTSEALGGRSANRGECAQACRMPYELIADGRPVPLGDRRYLLSPQDLAGLEVLPDLMRAGVASFKIEGRLKSPEYVANITRVYRQAIDETCVKTGPCRDGATQVAPPSTRASRYDLEMAFSRGLSTGWFRGIDNQTLVHARFGKKRGVYLGEVLQVQGGAVSLKLEAPLKPGDGVVFDAGHPDQPEEGGRVYAVEKHGAEARVRFGRGDIDFNRIHAGDRLWKTSDPELDRRLRQSFAGDQPHFQRAIDLEARGRAGEFLLITARDEFGHIAAAQSRVPLAPAEKQPLTSARLQAQLGRLGGTPFRLGEVHNQVTGDVILPLSELNRMRRELVATFEAARSVPKRWTLDPAPANWPGPASGGVKESKQQLPELVILVRSLPQLEAALQSGTRILYCEFEDPKRCREAVRMAREWRGALPPGIWVAPPRIFKTAEDWILKVVRSADADGYLVRNYDHLSRFAGLPCVGDFSLNVANPLTAAHFMERFGLRRLTASYDLNLAQLRALLRCAPPEWFEVTIHQHMPLFHMEHCVFCAFLSKGTDYTNCGRPCDKHSVKLRDRVGAEHLLKADAGCRNTLFNARAQTGAEHVADFVALGVRFFRIEFVDESPDQVCRTIRKYQQLLAGELSGGQLWRDLKLINQLGVTRGQMDKAEPLL